MTMPRLPVAGVLVALGFNLALLVLWLWSRGGQTTVIEVDATGDRFAARVDGVLVVPGADSGEEYVVLPAPARGGIQITLPRAAPSLPRPNGIDSVLITNSALTELYFEDGFDRLDPERWEVAEGAFAVRDGLLVPVGEGVNTLRLKSAGWQDYRVRLRMRNLMAGSLAVRLAPEGGAYYHFELVRDFPNLLSGSVGDSSSARFGGLPHTSKRENASSSAAMITRSYPFLLGTVAACALVNLLIMAAGRFIGRLRMPAVASSERTATAAAILIAAVSFVVTLYINIEHYGSVPHVPDEAAYLFQAKLLAAGRLMGDAPPVREAFYFYNPSFLFERGDQWASFYPFGHPLVLAAGEVFGGVKLVPSLAGATCVWLTFVLGRRLYGTGTGLLTAVLMAASPFFLMQASNFMSHNTASLFLLGALVFAVKQERPVVWGLIAGVCFGLLFNTRPLTALALALPLGLLILSRFVDVGERAAGLRHATGFVAGAVLLGVAFLAYNYGLTGSPLESAYAGNEGATIGFVGGHSLDVGMRNQQAQLTALVLVFNSWPPFAALALLLAPFVLGTRRRWDYFLLACAALPILAYTFYRFSGIFGGPRYWYDVAPLLFLLSARGAAAIAASASATALAVLARSGRASAPNRPAGAIPLALLLTVLIVEGGGGWLLGWNDDWSDHEAHLVPHDAAAVRTVFDTDGRLGELADRMQLKDALVLVQPCGFFRSPHCYGSVFLRNGIDFDAGVVWARFIPERNAAIIAAFPGRRVYVADWDAGSFRPYEDVRR
jgi:hypothetical protein